MVAPGAVAVSASGVVLASHLQSCGWYERVRGACAQDDADGERVRGVQKDRVAVNGLQSLWSSPWAR
ncbi:hypothetical protein GCM10020219_004510 [Nonomuraea dietziae]